MTWGELWIISSGELRQELLRNGLIPLSPCHGQHLELSDFLVYLI